jgi:N-acetylglucosamine-6-sulfatase
MPAPGERSAMRTHVPYLGRDAVRRMRRRSRVGALLACGVSALALIVSVDGGAAASGTASSTPAGASPSRPNIVLVLTDDLSSNLVRYMPHLRQLMNRGMTFTNYTVTDSLCCPSRASIFTGEFPHNTGVLSNTAPSGGYAAFQANADQTHTFAVNLRQAGYRTGFFGKYLNGYDPNTEPANPPGWSQWGAVGSGGYREYGYNLSLNGKIVHHGSSPGDYLTTVLDQMGRRFIRTSAAAATPFALEIATFSPHAPYVAAPSDVGTFASLKVPRTPAFNRHPANAPTWLAVRRRLTAAQIAGGDAVFRKRVECVQSVDRMIGDLETTLGNTGQLANTVFLFSSDNGFHISDYGLTAGKLTAFDTDVNVPLVVAGPGIASGSVDARPVENVDLAPTFDELAGAPIPAQVDGHSLVALLHGQKVPWRTLAEIEHVSIKTKPGDPDRQSRTAGRLPTYRAVRSATYTYVEYRRGGREYYDRTSDPYEIANTYTALSHRTINTLHAQVAALNRCSGYTQCWSAAAPTG